ncbi:hypothetical protein P7K49_024087 [Saguinus oedipus]|uniref:Uncharacterized protein n=1 Tax=Saguinus oedipus TaxID=9490 RepID=A0ABQ9UNH9_SAGOE|nr:hypothetical protein P7K49_024087 [Saguinus oedipus]
MLVMTGMTVKERKSEVRDDDGDDDGGDDNGDEDDDSDNSNADVNTDNCDNVEDSNDGGTRMAAMTRLIVMTGMVEI